MPDARQFGRSADYRCHWREVDDGGRQSRMRHVLVEFPVRPSVVTLSDFGRLGVRQRM